MAILCTSALEKTVDNISFSRIVFVYLQKILRIMQKLGYIVSDRKIKGVKGFVDVVSDISLADTSKPVLLVGLENAKKNIKNFSILEKKVGDNLYWTFKKTERRLDFEKDINYFYNIIYNNISSNIKYYYINIIKLKYNKIKKLYNIIYSRNKKYIYISDGMLYVLYENNVLGLSFDVLNFCGISREKIIGKLYENKNNVICTEASECVKPFKSEIGENKYVIPYFMSLM